MVLFHLIVFCIQLIILISFVQYQINEAEGNNLDYFSLRVILIIVFSMMIVPDYQISIKKIAVGFKMTSNLHKIITISLSLIQSTVTLVVLVSSILLIRITENMDDLLQNFTALYVIIQINEIMFKFLSLTNMINGLKILGFKNTKIQHLTNIKQLWRRKRTIIETKEKEMRIIVDRVLFYGQLFFYIFTICISWIVFSNDYNTFFF